MIHADLHLGNIHFVDDTTFAIFDFDHCAFGWRAYDLAPLRMSFDDARWEQALAGYERHAPVPAGVEHIDAFTKMRMLWDIGDILAMRTAWERDEVTEKVRENLPKIIEQVLLGPSARHQ